MHLRLVGHQLGERAPEPDRLGREVPAAAVPLVEDQVDDCEHRGEAVGEQMSRRHAKRDPGGPDLALRADEPLGHGRLGNEEGAGDLLRRSPPSVRSVSATWASSASAGWQHVKMSSSRSSGIVVSSTSSSSGFGTSSSRVFAASVRSRRMRSIARLRAVVTSQARGLAGVPSRGQRSAAIANAS